MHHVSPPHLFWRLVRPHVESVVLGFAAVLGLFLISGSDQVFAQGGVWVTKTPMPTARSHVMAAGIAGKLYVVGGQISCCDVNEVNALEVYDPATDTWTTKAPMHQARNAGGSAVIGGKLYVVGGRIPDIDVATLEMYDPTTNTWTTKTPMPTPRRWPAVEAIGGLLYVTGGTQEGPGPGSLSTLEVYDPASNTWTTKASLPVPREAMASGVIDGKLYLAGGATNGEILATLLVYDPGTNTWAEKSPMPTARDFPAGAVIDGQLYVVTGIVDFDSPPVRTVEVYDPATDTWRAAAPIPTGRDRLGEVGIIGGKLYVVGGWNPCFACDIATLEVFEPTGAQICVQPPSGLVSWWPGDENADDIVGGRNAVLRNDATFSLGLVDQAFMLDGDGDFIEVPHDSALNVGTGDFTVDLWVFFNDTAGEQVLVEKWIQRFPCTPCEGWTFTKLEGNFLHMALFSGDGSGELVFSEVLTIPPGTWRHFAARRQSGEITLFMNGAPVASGKFSGNLDSISSLKFGHRGSPSDTPGSEDERGFFLNGRIDEVEVFVGQALSDAEILAIFNAGSAGKCKGPVARVPTSTEQCKKGGWMNLTDDAGRPFKNQGDCVSFVATRGKNPAGG